MTPTEIEAIAAAVACRMGEPTNSDVMKAVRGLDANHERTLGLLTGLAVRKESRREQARKMKVHPSTLWRRERRAEIKAMSAGILT
jgi:hypothetical protein